MPDNRWENKAFVGAIPFGGEYHGSQFEDKFQSANQMDGIVIAGGGKMADSWDEFYLLFDQRSQSWPKLRITDPAFLCQDENVYTTC